MVSNDAALLQLVRDDQAAATLRRDAATAIIDRGSPETAQALIALLHSSTDAGLRRTVILGLSAAANPPASAVDALLELADELDASLIDDAGQVIGRAMTEKHLKTVQRLATDRKAHPTERLVTIAALGHRRTQAAAATLVSLIERPDSAAITTTASNALARLSGITAVEGNRKQWTAWWSEVKSLTPAQWQTHLLSNFTRRSENLARQRALLQERLLTTMRQRYRAVAKEERDALLVSMLADPLDAVRLLSLDLIREIVNTETVNPPLISALITRLNDQTPAVRAAAALLLRDLKSPEAADLVATRLADLAESDKAALKAYLLLMRRMPRLAAIGPAITLLDDPDVRAEAAGALLAGFEHQPPLVGLDQSQRIATFLRTQMAVEEVPEPRFIELLGRVGNSDDFTKILGWLDHRVDAVREAAARAWVASPRSLEALARRAEDPIIQAIVIPAVTARGQSAQTLLALIKHRPSNEQLAQAWGRALVAMAPRVDPDAVVTADRVLMSDTDASELRMQILSAAIDGLLARVRTADVAELTGSERQIYSLQLIDLLLARAEARLASGDSKASLADLDRVAALNIDLSNSQQQRYTLTTIHARIVGGDLEEAFRKAGKYLTGEPTDAATAELKQRVLELLILNAEQSVTGKQYDRAGQIVTHLRTRLPQPVELKLESRLSDIEHRIKLAVKSPPDNVPSPPMP